MPIWFWREDQEVRQEKRSEESSLKAERHFRVVVPTVRWSGFGTRKHIDWEIRNKKQQLKHQNWKMFLSYFETFA
jgi:hypothetical protein